MPKPRLTRKQKGLVEELEHLLAKLGLDLADIVAEAEPAGRGIGEAGLPLRSVNRSGFAEAPTLERMERWEARL